MSQWGVNIEQETKAEGSTYDKNAICALQKNEHAGKSLVEMLPKAYLLL